jgi:propanediol utilization protein
MLLMNAKDERTGCDTKVAVPIAISRSHVHLTAAVIEELFCDRYSLHKAAPASQPSQYITMEKVTLVGPTGRRILGVPIIGPPRAVNQIELSLTDAQSLEIRAPVRESGDLVGTPGIVVVGPRTQVKLGTGVICAQRHVHLTPADARRLALSDRDRTEVSTTGTRRGIVFKDVLVRVSPEYQLELHLDLDEANAAGLKRGDSAWLERRVGVSRPDVDC